MKRIIVLMLACLMLLSCLPFAAFAAEEAHEAELAECPGKDKTHTDAHIHLAQVITTVDPQCGERGYTVYLCECGAMFFGSYVEADPTATHTWREVTAAKAATCTKEGTSAVLECTVCEVREGGVATDKAPHNFVLNDATGEVMCAECGEIQPESECSSEEATDKKHNWDYSAPIATVDPTCSVSGSATFACGNKDCTATKIIVVEATGKHDLGDLVEIKNATCTESGVSAVHYVCKTCNKAFAEDKETELKAKDYFVAATGHAYSCTVDTTKVVCENPKCNELVAIENAKPIHNTNNTANQNKDADCTNYGYKIEICTDCGEKVKNEVIAPLGHKIDSTKAPALDSDKEVNKPGEEGIACAPLYNRYYCTRDNCTEAVYVKVKDAKPHTYVEDVVIQEATCSLKKKTATVCSVCSYIDDATIEEFEINADNHVDIEVVRKIADCKAATASTAIVSCKNCTYVSNVTIAKNSNHKLVYTPVGEDNAPTCTETGLGNVTCVYCTAADDVTGTVVIPKLGHDNGKLVETIPATCTAKAQEVYKGDCSRCDVTEWTVEVGEVSKALTFNSKAEADVVHTLTAKEGNNCANGYEYYVCSDCRKDVFVYSESTNHTYEDYSCVGVKDEEDGKYYNVCVACGYKKETTVAKHNLKFVSAVKPTCNENGSIKFACKNTNCTLTVVFEADDVVYTFGKTEFEGDPAELVATEDVVALLVAYFGEDAIADIITALEDEYKTEFDETLYNFFYDLMYEDEYAAAKEKAEADAEEAGVEFDEVTFKAEYEADFNEVTFKATVDEAYEFITAYYAVQVAVEEATTATGHKNNTPKETKPTCLTDGYKAETKCTVCGTITASAVVTKATKHNFAIATATPVASTTLGCLQAEYKVYACINDNCNAEIVTGYTAARNHENKAGEVITPSCTDTVADRKCVHCKTTVPTHDEEKEIVNSTCTSQGYTITYCEVCGEILKTALNPGYGEHHFIDVEKEYASVAAFIAAVKAGEVENVIYTPALYKDGKIEFKCNGCDEINEELTITLKAEDEIGADYNKYIGLTLAVDNANKAGASISDSSVVAVTVNLNSAAAIKVWGVNFRFDYDWTKLTFVGYEFAEDSAFDGYINAVNKFETRKVPALNNVGDELIDENGDVVMKDEITDAYIQIGANTANDVNGKTVNAVIDGENIALVTLYFEVTSAIEDDGETVKDVIDDFGLSNVTILNNKGETVKHKEETKALTVEKFLDFNKDGAVTFADVLCVWQMISGETEADYNAVVDVDKNGIVEAKDFMDLYAYVLGELDYEDMVAIAA